jgi:hypothetical protein
MVNPMEGQLNQFRQQAAQSGFSGTGIIDVQPKGGIIRLKLNITPPGGLKVFTKNFAEAIGVMLGAMNIQVKIHIEQEE